MPLPPRHASRTLLLVGEGETEVAFLHCANRSYDLRAALLDTDLPWSANVRKKALHKRIALVGSSPCLEGLLLEVLGRSVPARSPDCKRVLNALFAGNPLRTQDYAAQFDRPILDAARSRVATLAQLLALFP
jgi:hypothetical protein